MSHSPSQVPLKTLDLSQNYISAPLLNCLFSSSGSLSKLVLSAVLLDKHALQGLPQVISRFSSSIRTLSLEGTVMDADTVKDLCNLLRMHPELQVRLPSSNLISFSLNFS